MSDVSVIIPCRNEAGSIRDVVSRVPDGAECVVVDNGSDDDTAELARRAGAQVIAESRPGYGSAVTAGVLAASGDVICTLDGDGSMDPGDLRSLLAPLAMDADLVAGRRRPVGNTVWPIHARAGSLGVAWYLRHRYGLPVHDIGPMRAIRRQVLIDLDVHDRRSGYPVELLLRAAQHRLRVTEVDVAYSARTAGESKVSGSLRGSVRAARDFVAVLS